jgi:hypothetical protein
LCRNHKVINLPHKDNSFTINGTGIQAWFMSPGVESKFSKDGNGMFFPESWWLRVALNCWQHRNYMTRWDGRVSFVILPQFDKGVVMADVKALFGWGSFSKRIAYAGAKDKHILGSGDSVE